MFERRPRLLPLCRTMEVQGNEAKRALGMKVSNSSAALIMDAREGKELKLSCRAWAVVFLLFLMRLPSEPEERKKGRKKPFNPKERFVSNKKGPSIGM